MKKKITFLLACLSMSLYAADKPLLVGTNTDFPPFSFIENKEIVGFDIDVVKEVGKRLGKELKFKDMPFDALIPDITMGHIDCIAGGVCYTEDRAKRVLLTKSYITGDMLVILSRSDKIKGIDDLKGKTVAVVEGYTSDTLMSSTRGVKVVRLAIQSDCFMALHCGRVDAFVTAKSTMEDFLKTVDASQYHSIFLPEHAETCCMVVSKKNPKFFDEIQAVLDAMENDGTMTKLKTKWNLK